METKIEFFWDAGSPYTYLASTKVQEVADRCGVPVEWRPFLLGGVFRETGNKPPLDVAAKGSYMIDDLETWARFYNVPFRFPSFFPVSSLLPMRAAVAAHRLGEGVRFAREIMKIYWVEETDPSVPENVQAAARAAGLDGETVLRMTQDPEIKETLKMNSGEAVARGAFGAPTFFVGKKMFWGNDRLLLLEAYLKGDCG